MDPFSLTSHDREALNVHYPNEDAIVIVAQVANHMVFKMLIDNDNSVDILYISAYNAMGLKIKAFKLVRVPLSGFTRETIFLDGSTELLLTMGDFSNRPIVMVNFLVMKTLSTYNAIIGRPTLNALMATTSTYHLMMKFMTLTWGISCVHWD